MQTLGGWSRSVLAGSCALALAGCLAGGGQGGAVTALPGRDPQNATYFIDEAAIALHAGRAVTDIIPGAASRTTTTVFGQPVFGDLDGDGINDAALLLVRTTGGSGTFFYVAAALRRDGAWHGTNAVFLGDRIAPQAPDLDHGLLTVHYADRLPGEAMATPPSRMRSRWLRLDGGRLEEIPVAEGEQVLPGMVVIGHEVHSFTACGAGEAAWLVGDAPALEAIITTYRTTLAEAPPYTPLFMILAGRPVASPADGFGADYPSGFRATQLLLSRPGATCPHP